MVELRIPGRNFLSLLAMMRMPSVETLTPHNADSTSLLESYFVTMKL
jgi:hypothetical protein